MNLVKNKSGYLPLLFILFACAPEFRNRAEAAAHLEALNEAQRDEQNRHDGENIRMGEAGQRTKEGDDGAAACANRGPPRWCDERLALGGVVAVRGGEVSPSDRAATATYSWRGGDGDGAELDPLDMAMNCGAAKRQRPWF